ncbi:DUF1244 domain-containing protein [Yunchengibacter salinarum]|uniref:DUF1244 domain-containing protein n=1 Tax=Yunchengibacter salinarum TaxID=3133399 RepID=UPI0035B5E435
MTDPNNLDVAQRDRIEARAFRTLLDHLALRSDVQNVDLMGLAGFCRNCLSDWLRDAAEAEGVSMDKGEARAHVYGMAYEDWKARHQTPASEAQIRAMDESVSRNKALRAARDRG